MVVDRLVLVIVTGMDDTSKHIKINLRNPLLKFENKFRESQDYKISNVY